MYNTEDIKAPTMMKFSFWFLFLALASGFFLVQPAYADEPQEIGVYGDWTAYTVQEDGGKACYMLSKPSSSAGKYGKRGDVYALITHRPAQGARDVFSYITGYSYKVESDAIVTIDNQKFVLFTQDETAWAPDADADKKLAHAIQNGTKMSVQGTSARGTLTKDSFSLKGATAAYKAISDACAG